MKMSSIVHFELPGSDLNRMAKFYATVFGWKALHLGEKMDNYVLVQTAETDEDGMLKRPGAINGGFFTKDAEKPMAQYSSLVIGIDDAQAKMKAIEAAGGKVVSGPNEVPGYGLYVTFTDTEGNMVSMMQPTAEWMKKTE